MSWLSNFFKQFSSKEDPKLKSYLEHFDQSPNCSSRIIPKFIILHHSSGSFAGGVSWIKQAKSEVSYHYMIASSGKRVQFVKDSVKAWHAGKSIWRGWVGLNKHSIGIAFWGDTNLRKPSFSEIDSCAEKCIELMDKFAIPLENVLSHRQIAPKRKNDPSPSVMGRVHQRIKERLV